MIGTKPKQPLVATWDQRWALADAVGLPREWFSADYDRLHEIADEDSPIFRRSLPEDHAEEAAQRLGDSEPSSEGTPDAEDDGARGHG